jgi:calmodulin-lysine N-methyltransferase
VLKKSFCFINNIYFVFFLINFAEETSNDQQDKNDTNKISRKTSRGFDLIECHMLPISQSTKSHGDSSSRNENIVECHNDVRVCYKLPCEGSPKLNLV